MPIIHREASEPTKLPPQHVTYHHLFMIAFGLLLMLPRAIELLEANPFIIVIIMLHICKKKSNPKRKFRSQGTASTKNLSTKKPFNQSTWSGLLLIGHVSTSLYNGRLASPPSTATSNTNTTTSSTTKAGGSLGNELQKFTNLAEPVASSTGYFCITEALIGTESAKEIALNVTQHGGTEDIYIYRFPPGSTITVSINWESFKDLKLSHDQAANFRDHLERAINIIRFGCLGIQFRLVPDEELGLHMRGVIDVQYGGEGRLPHSATIGWARSQFPQPNKHRYVLEVFSTTFEPEFRDCICNIMLHELGHFMNMRHHPYVQRTAWKNEPLRLLHPAGDSNTRSIMGDWNNLQDLEFSETDIRHSRDFYNLRAGLYSTRDLGRGRICHVWLVDVPVKDGLIRRTYS